MKKTSNILLGSVLFWGLSLLVLASALAPAGIAEAASDSLRQECLRGKGVESAPACLQAIKQDPKDLRLFLVLGERLDKARRYEDAVRVYTKAKTHHPDSEVVAQKLAIAQSNLDEQNWIKKRESGRGDTAIAAADDRTARIANKLNEIKCQRLTGGDALKACDAVIAAAPGNSRLHAARGDALVDLGRMDDAVAAYSEAVKLNPKDVETQNKLAALTEAVPEITVAKTPPPTPKTPAAEKQVAAVLPPAPKMPDAPPPVKDPFVAQMKTLQLLKNQKLISDNEFEERKATLLDSKFSKALRGPDADFAAASQPPVNIDFGNYFAVVIGNNDYKFLPKLKTALADAGAVAEVLRKKYDFKVSLLLNATRYDILKEMARLRGVLTENDSLLIYYAGHGILDEAAEQGYWLPVDAEENIKSNWISNADITDSLKATDAWHVMVVADSCYSGTLVRGAIPVMKATGGSRRKLLKRLTLKKSRTALTSGGLEPVVDSGGGRHSVFAKAFLDVLTENNQALEAQQVFTALRAKVVLNADQTPEYADVRKAGHDGGDFIFVPKQ